MEETLFIWGKTFGGHSEIKHTTGGEDLVIAGQKTDDGGRGLLESLKRHYDNLKNISKISLNFAVGGQEPCYQKRIPREIEEEIKKYATKLSDKIKIENKYN